MTFDKKLLFGKKLLDYCLKIYHFFSKQLDILETACHGIYQYFLDKHRPQNSEVETVITKHGEYVPVKHYSKVTFEDMMKDIGIVAVYAFCIGVICAVLPYLLIPIFLLLAVALEVFAVILIYKHYKQRKKFKGSK